VPQHSSVHPRVHTPRQCGLCRSVAEIVEPNAGKPSRSERDEEYFPLPTSAPGIDGAASVRLFPFTIKAKFADRAITLRKGRTTAALMCSRTLQTQGPSGGGERGDRDIGDEHVPGCVRDH
jgi:hypothetical protein